MNPIRLVTERHVQDLRMRVSVTAKDSPHLPEFEAELVEAETHLLARNEVTKAALKNGYIVNNYPGTCDKTGVEVKPRCGFAKRVAGRWVTVAFAVMQEEVKHPGVQPTKPHA
jgi:hypothetical protein